MLEKKEKLTEKARYSAGVLEYKKIGPYYSRII